MSQPHSQHFDLLSVCWKGLKEVAGDEHSSFLESIMKWRKTRAIGTLAVCLHSPLGLCRWLFAAHVEINYRLVWDCCGP